MKTEDLNNKRRYWENAVHKNSGTGKPTFNRAIFFGDGGRSSNELCYILHKRLEEAFSEIGAEQQNGGMGSTYDKMSGSECIALVSAVVREVAIALTGREITFLPLQGESTGEGEDR